jgi:hypothetical protein
MDRTFGKIFRIFILFIRPKVLSIFTIFKLDVG